MTSINPKYSPKKIWKAYLKRKWLFYTIGTLSVFATNFMQVFLNRNVGWLIDFFMQKEIPEIFMVGNRDQIFMVLFLAMVFSRVFLAIGRFGWRYFLARQSHQASCELKNQIFESAVFFSRKDLDETFTKGQLMNASNSDVNSSKFLFGFTLVGITDFVFLTVLSIIAMLFINVELTVLSLATLLILPYFVKKLSQKEIERYKDSQDCLGDFNDLATQAIGSIRLQRLTSTGETWTNRLMEKAQEYRKKRLTAAFTSTNYIPVMGSGSLMAMVVLFFVGVKSVLAGELSLGDFVSMQNLIFLIQEPLMELGFIISELKRSGASLGRLCEVYNHPVEEYLITEAIEVLKNKDQEVPVFELDQLSFSYPNGERILKDFSLKVMPGERLGIKGEIGSGKSTLVRILSGLERNHTGSVKLKGKKFSEYSHLELRKNLVVVSQSPFLFATTVRENVKMELDITDQDIWKFLDWAGLKDDVEKFPNQLDTQLGEWGINLSGGQKQRLTLTRAFARNPKILLMDDCLSAVDTMTEEKILKNINFNFKETTIVWVAHRDSTLKYCHRVLDLTKVQTMEAYNESRP